MKLALVRLLACAAALLPAVAARAAAPVSFTVDPLQSGADIALTVTVVGSDSDSATVTWSGSATGELLLTFAGGLGLRAETLEIQASAISQSDASFSVNPGVPLTIDFTDWEGALEGPGSAITGAPVAANTSEFDLAGGALTFDSGLIDLGVGSLDLSEAPFSFVFQEGDVATVVTRSNGDVVDVTVSIPVAESTSVTESGVTVDVDIDGTLVLTGSAGPPVAVPLLSTPGMLVLGAALLAGSLLAARRAR